MSETFLTPKEKRIRRRLRVDWIRRYTGLFGEPPRLREFQEGTISFRELHSASLKTAENMVAEVSSLHADAFDNEA